MVGLPSVCGVYLWWVSQVCVGCTYGGSPKCVWGVLVGCTYGGSPKCVWGVLMVGLPSVCVGCTYGGSPKCVWGVLMVGLPSVCVCGGGGGGTYGELAASVWVGKGKLLR